MAGLSPAGARGASWTVAGVQLLVMVDHLMVLPLGPDLARGVGLPVDRLGLLVGAYTLAAAAAGLVLAPRLDRVSRRGALCVCLGGVAVASLGAASAQGWGALLAARLVAGACGGPALALGQAVVADVAPEGRRGRALAQVLGANAVASVVGVPAGLLLAEAGGWSAPFLVVGVGALLAALGVWWWMPGVGGGAPPPRWGALLHQRGLGLAAGVTALAAGSTFLLAPNLSAFVQHNGGLPREALPGLYALGGLGALGAMAAAGRLVDRRGASAVVGGATVLLVVGMSALVWGGGAQGLLAGAFVALMGGIAARNVPVRTLSTRVPAAEMRAGTLVLLSAIQQGAGAAGAVVSAALLTEGPGGALGGMEGVVVLAVALSLLALGAVWRLERLLGRVRGDGEGGGPVG